MITAPYNFVPLNKEIFYPDWDKDVSHDIPFEDGESGVIEIKISAQTAIFIRNHYVEGDDFYLDSKNNRVSTEFCHLKDSTGAKQYYIPASSIKGMIRNIVEIMSFSKINIDEKTLDKPLSVRDMTQDNKTGDIFNHDMVATAKKCGFLIKESDNYFIEECGNVLTIKDDEIRMKVADYSKEIDTAQKKYHKFGHVLDFPFERDTRSDENGRKTTVALYAKASKTKAQLVMTGFIDNKKNEFIFQPNGRRTALKQTVFENFEKVYFKNKDSIDGQYWKEEWKSGEGRRIPIFYIEKDTEISAIGLTQIFKLAYKKSLLEAINQSVKNDRLDLTQTIFGTVKEEQPLKGRVQFSHFKSTHVTYEKEKSEILGSPQPTYYPNYLRQTNTNGDKVNRYMTLMDNAVEISGYKRYPLHHTIKPSFIPKEEKTDIQTKFKPLNKGSLFIGKLRFHNLKKVEIGAILSALTFHGHHDCRHNIGMAKSLGFGKIKIDVALNNLKYKQNDYLEAYEKEMTLFMDKWIESPQIIELLSMANSKIVSDRSLEYQKLENPNTRDREKNDFTRAKKNKEYLKKYSQSGNVEPITLKSLIHIEEIDAEREKRRLAKEESDKLNREKEAQKRVDEERKRREDDLLKKEKNKWKAIHEPRNKHYLKDALNKFIEDFPTSSKIAEAKQKLEELSHPPKSQGKPKTLDFSEATDGKSIERAMKAVQNPSDDDKDLLEKTIREVYPNLNAKKKKQFMKIKLMVTWLGKERFDAIIKELA